MAIIQLVALKAGIFSEKLIPRWWHRLTLFCLGIRVKVDGALVSDRPLLVASNHVSWTDIMVIGAYADVRFIAKSDVAGWPGWGTIARLNRTVFVERERKTRTGAQTDEIATRMAAGDAMVLFPEGTTADGNLLLPFKTSLFGAADAALAQGEAERIFIQPVAVAYVRKHGVVMSRGERVLVSWAGSEGLWPHLKRLLRAGSVDARLSFGPPIEYTRASRRKEVARAVEGEVKRLFEQMRDKPLAAKPVVTSIRR
ncbi:MAG: lysophospholipid acyltransferase family protein [Mesorhizobium sp.]